jgi:hypothetical protein
MASPTSTAGNHQAEPPTHERSPVQLKVFISYSRRDSAFADELVRGLEFDGDFEVSIDRNAIHEGEEWKARLGALIAAADTIVFILSPASAASPICLWEVDEAVRLSKRIIPVQALPLGQERPPERLAALNYVRFDPEDDGEPRSFMVGLAGLRRALKTDIGWLREHTRLLVRAREWDSAGRTPNRMLTGSDIVAAKTWLDAHPREAPEPTELHRDFIKASDEAETARLSEERARANRLQRAVTWMRVGLGAALVLAVIAGGAGLWANTNRQIAGAERDKANAALGKAAELLELLLPRIPVGWPSDDTKSPDYRHIAATPLGKQLKGAASDVSAETLRLLLAANAFEPIALNDKVVVILRGATMAAEAPAQNVDRIRIIDKRPDHRTFDSVYIVWDRSTGKLSGFTGSTVPNANFMRAAFKSYFGESTTTSANLISTGSYGYRVGQHGGGRILGAFRLGSHPAEDGGPVAVRRSYNDLTYDVTDRWDVATPYNNLHPAYSLTQFSSAGALTIRGVFKDNRHSADFAGFRGALGLDATTHSAKDNDKPITMTILTGLDAIIAAAIAATKPEMSRQQRDLHILRLRPGSRSEHVKKLQAALGVEVTGYQGAATTSRLAKLQDEKLKWSDGLYSPEMEERLGFCVFRNASECERK